MVSGLSMFSCLASLVSMHAARMTSDHAPSKISLNEGLRAPLSWTFARESASNTKLSPFNRNLNSRALAMLLLGQEPAAGFHNLCKSTSTSGTRSAHTSLHKLRGGHEARMSAQKGNQVKESGYRVPESDFVELVDAPTQPSLSLDPSKRWLLLMENPPMLTLEDLCREERKLAGLRFDPLRLLPARASGYTRLLLQPLFDSAGQPFPVKDAPQIEVKGCPEGSKFRSVSWRPRKGGFAFVVLPPNSGDPQLWYAEFDPDKPDALPESIYAEQLLDSNGNPLKLNGIRGSPIQWHPDGERFLLDTVPWPEKREEKKGTRLKLPTAPSVQNSMPGVKAPARTYQDLLSSIEDEEEYERYTTIQLLLYDLKNRQAEPLGRPDMYRSCIISPDGLFMLVSATRQPFSYLVPDGRFARDIEIWKLPLQGQSADQDSEWLVASLPVREQIPLANDGVEDMPRSFQWRPDAPHSLWFVEALDGGDPKNPASADGYRDQLCQIEGPPFQLDKKAIVTQMEWRYAGHSSTEDGTHFFSEYRWKDRQYRQWVFHEEGDAGTIAREGWLLVNMSFEDQYNDPGDFVMKRDLETGYSFLLRSSNGKVFLRGSGASPRGNRPFVDELSLSEAREAGVVNATKRLWRCIAGVAKPGEPVEDPAKEVGGVLPSDAARRDEYERPAVIFGGDQRDKPLRMLFWRESQDKPPNLYMRDLDSSALGDSKEEIPITDFQHPQPSLKTIRKQLIRYKRKDGIDLTAELYLPPGYDKKRDGRLPCLMWAYPQEFKSSDAAGQVSSAPHSFVRAYWSQPTFWLLRGYAVFDDPQMPVVGEGDEEPNDSFIEQLKMNAEAAVDCVVNELGVADRDRICIGGHSYGAFMTSHLLAHTDLFRAGICRSGAYNRVLTPFGFQGEERTYWEATETYTTMSAFLYAKQLAEKNAPLLLIHGEDDPNPGTFPMQSERFFQALKGHGATSKLVLLPKEQHGYRARESILHVLWEQDAWLREHNAPKEN